FTIAAIRARRMWLEDVLPREVRFVSVVIAMEAASTSLDRTILDVFEQTYPHFEMVALGDLSKRLQTTVDPSEGSVRWIDQVERSFASSWNMGLRRTVGDYLAFLREGDRITPDAIQSALNSLETHPESALVVQASAGGRLGVIRRSVFDYLDVFSGDRDPREDLYRRIAAIFPVHEDRV